MYRALRPLIFALEPELSHDLASAALLTGLRSAPARRAVRRRLAVDRPDLKTRVFGLDFDNPLGVAAGFDKQARTFNALAALGFSFVEVGTVTARPQDGNPRPRIWRYPERRALRNAMGFPNPGADVVAERLRRTSPECVLGVNIGRSKDCAPGEEVDDFLYTLRALGTHADYITVNVSSPNTPGLRALQDPEPLAELLGALVVETDRPLLVKLAPELTDEAIDDVLTVAVNAGCAGVVATNSTIDHSYGPGGLSGAPLRSRALEVVARCARAMPTIGSGGVMDPDDAQRMLDAGASLVQLYTGLVYGGPTVARTFQRRLTITAPTA